MATRADIVAAARSWEGVRWHHQGRNREGGVDCLGLPVMVARELGLSTYDIANYPREPNVETFLPHFIAAGCARINPRDARDGDIVTFRQRARPCHVGIFTEKHGVRHVIHASRSHGKVVEEPLPDPRGSPGAPIVAVFRMPGVED